IVIQATTLWIGMPGTAEAMAFLRIPEGTEVRILEDASKYYKIAHNELIGYVDRSHVKPAHANDVALSVNEATPQALPTLAKKENPKPGNSASSSYVVTQATSLRTGPDSQNSVILRLPEGGGVEVLEKTGKYWWKVTYKGKTGWAKAALLQQN
ncbi:SH3 domain-containing protein, partial [Arthrospira platensis SPKY1]|nr:SH3 domain-containing protein [Arthrospira platensis SPKY1]